MNARGTFVTFVVPCYNLGHLLQECVDSILGQTYEHFEIVIMDDCSPDGTQAVATSFSDPRVRYVRNENNLGHLRNYNKGIQLARGEYVWLISADDTLRAPEALQQFVSVLDAHPAVAFVFSKAMRVLDGHDVGSYPSHAVPTGVVDGRKFLEALLDWNFIPAAGTLVRKSAYLQANLFPLDLPYAGDWYMWCMFALVGDVGYVPEVLVNYRQHELSMTTYFKARADALRKDEFDVRWRMKRHFEARGLRRLSRISERLIAQDYARRLTASQGSVYHMTWPEVETSISNCARDSAEASKIICRVHAECGDAAGNTPQIARHHYGAALRQSPWMVKTAIKLALSYARWRQRESVAERESVN
jgi:glycosyltransferase involved in cell wall biosynthesis